MLNYVKIPDVNLDLIKYEIQTVFADMTGGNSYETHINFKNVPHTIFRLVPIIDMYGPETQRIFSMLEASYGELKNVSINIFRRGGQITEHISGTSPEFTSPGKASVMIPVGGNPVHLSWWDYTGEFKLDVIDESVGLNRLVPVNEDAVSINESINLDAAIACNVSKVHRFVHLKPGFSAFITCVFENQDKMLSDIKNNTLFG